MISLFRNLVSPKVSARLVFRGNISGRSGLTIQAVIQSHNINGFMRIRPGAFVQIDLEGPQSKIETLIAQLRQMEVGTGHVVLETAWGEYKKQFENFRATIA